MFKTLTTAATLIATLTTGASAGNLSQVEENYLVNNILYFTIAKKCGIGFEPTYAIAVIPMTYDPSLTKAAPGEVGPLVDLGRANAETIAQQLGGWEVLCEISPSVLNDALGLKVFQ